MIFWGLLQGEIQNGKPQLLAVVPSAAFAGGVISFILCPSELIKVSEVRSLTLLFELFTSFV